MENSYLQNEYFSDFETFYEISMIPFQHYY